jgi:hypothetical protein
MGISYNTRKPWPESGTLKTMNSEEKDNTSRSAAGTPAGTPASKDEVALELMRFITVTTGIGKTSSGPGFGGKSAKTTDEQVDALIQLYERCRAAVGKAS